jgi:hypothetical protein
VLRGSGVKAGVLRKRTEVVRSEGGGVKVDGLRKRTAAARSEAGVKDGWWRRHDGF